MTYHVKAIYENGVLKLEQPLPLKENQQVQLVVHTALSAAERSYGIMQWKGSVEDLEYLAESPDLDPAERFYDVDVDIDQVQGITRCVPTFGQ